ncbi:MAG: DUF4292 domain-containing protein [Bacteroidales bacterium]|nr:DUF4292 domain-containing protein [Bacteroidales bacterium]
MKIINLITCIFLVIIISGCHSSKRSINSEDLSSDISAEKIPLQARLDSVVAMYGTWTDVELPVDLALMQPTEINLSGRASMVKDESIYISIRVFGFEAANIYINNDSIFASYKMGKLYIAESIKSLLSGHSVTVGDLQNMLLGRAFILEKGSINSSMKNDFTMKYTDNSWLISPKSKYKNIKYQYSFDLSNNMLEELLVTINETNKSTCKYGSFSNSDAGIIANDITILSSLKNNTINAMISWDMNKAKWNTGVNRKWKMPKGYKKIETASLLRLF